MKITLYGSPICGRCKNAKNMLDKREIEYEYISLINQQSMIVNDVQLEDLPVLLIDNEMYVAKDALIKIRELK